MASDRSPAGRSDFESVAQLESGERDRTLRALGDEGMHRLTRAWEHRARPEQRAPAGDWSVWLVMAGRGFGKTRLGAEWVRAVAEGDGMARIALIGASLGEARSVMVEGPSGLLSIAPASCRPSWRPSRNRLVWPNGARAFLYGAAQPEALRGPEHSHMWADEIGKWPRAQACWDNAMMGLRLGESPRAVATTTPRPTGLLRHLLSRPDIAVTRGRTTDNIGALPTAFSRAMAREYGRTRLGRQELEGELLLDVEGALWTRETLDRCRTARPAHGRWPDLCRVVVGVDPPAGRNGDACGIVVVGVDDQGCAHVLEDASMERSGPEQWARRAVDCFERWQADRIVAEANNGGAMVESVLRAVESGVAVRLVYASQGKSARAEPVAALYEAGRVCHHGLFAELEDQMAGMVIGGGYSGPGRSPDRADALVWGLTELMLHRNARPRVTGL